MMDKLSRARAQFTRVLVLLGGFSLIVNLLLLAMPLYMLQIYDRILPARSMDTLLFLSIIVAGALVVLGLLEAVRAILASRAAARLEANLGAEALRSSLGASRNGEADIDAVRNLAAVRQFITSRMIFSLLDFPFAPIFIGILYVIHPTLFWLTLAGAVVLLILAVVNQQVTKNVSANASGQQASSLVVAQSMARNSDSLTAMGMEKNAVSLWGRYNSRSLINQGSADYRNAVLTGISRTIRMGLQVAVLGVGAVLVLNHEMTAGMIFAASIISGRALQPIDQVIGGWKQFAATWGAWKSLESSLEKSGAEKERTLMDAPQGRIQVDNALVLGPSGTAATPLLNRISFDLRPGKVLGVVGPSGSGKTTLARLLVGAQVPNSGQVRIDGAEVENWNREQLGQHIGYLGQDVEMLPGTIKENIARLADKPDDIAVLDAARKAQVHALIQNLPQGYDTMIGPGGMGLSGGQRQRIGLARAFYGNPQIMVLDEPNANLDDDGELALQKAIEAASAAGVTVVMVTQRKRILNSVDLILRLHSGTLDYFGTKNDFVALLQEKRRGLMEVAQKIKAPPTAPTSGEAGKIANSDSAARDPDDVMAEVKLPLRSMVGSR
ncbi:MAG: type I secretion system permease/ATPase [Rhizobiaceae bacterium]